jgi:nitrogen fixation/metabolism regulation signal transduction histidine kinase
LVRSKVRPTHSQTVASALAGKPLIDDIRGRFASFDRRQQALADERRRDTASSARTAKLVAVGGFALVVLLLAIPLATYLGRAILVPIRRVDSAARRLGEGELNIRVPQRSQRQKSWPRPAR